MIVSLSIENFALIEKLSVRFSDGFSVITGETGAGKSILLGALGLVLGKRADLSSLKNKEFGEIKPTILYPRNIDVEKINKLESEKLILAGAKKQDYKLDYTKSKNIRRTKS